MSVESKSASSGTPSWRAARTKLVTLFSSGTPSASPRRRGRTKRPSDSSPRDRVGGLAREHAVAQARGEPPVACAAAAVAGERVLGDDRLEPRRRARQRARRVDHRRPRGELGRRAALVNAVLARRRRWRRAARWRRGAGARRRRAQRAAPGVAVTACSRRRRDTDTDAVLRVSEARAPPGTTSVPEQLARLEERVPATPSRRHARTKRHVGKLVESHATRRCAHRAGRDRVQGAAEHDAAARASASSPRPPRPRLQAGSTRRSRLGTAATPRASPLLLSLPPPRRVPAPVSPCRRAPDARARGRHALPGLRLMLRARDVGCGRAPAAARSQICARPSCARQIGAGGLALGLGAFATTRRPPPPAAAASSRSVRMRSAAAAGRGRSTAAPPRLAPLRRVRPPPPWRRHPTTGQVTHTQRRSSSCSQAPSEPGRDAMHRARRETDEDEEAQARRSRPRRPSPARAQLERASTPRGRSA